MTELRSIMRFLPGILLAYAVVFISCSNLMISSSEIVETSTERPVTVETLTGRWSDYSKQLYFGGGFVEVSRKFEFTAEGNFTLSQETYDNPAAGSTRTYAGIIGTFELSGTTISCYATKSRSSATPFLSDNEGWVTLSSSEKVLESPAMIYGPNLFWNPSFPVWRQIASSDPHCVLALEASVKNLQKPEERQTWSFSDAGASLLTGAYKDSDGLWQQSYAMLLNSRVENGKLYGQFSDPTLTCIPILQSGGKFFFGNEGISRRY